MKMQIVDRHDILDDAGRELAERRLRFALTRFEPQVARVLLVLRDVNGPRGGIDKACRLDVHLRDGNPLSISDADANALAAVSRVADRAGRAVGRRLQRDD